MRVFVVGTGRCGSVSFRAACSQFITNYQVGHETLCGLREYPDRFIEINPHLRLSIVNVSSRYPDAKWVHLVRSPETCVPSLAALDHGAVMRAYQTLHSSVMRSNAVGDVAFSYYWDTIDTINALLEYKVPSYNRMRVSLENIARDWRTFWDWIGAEGDFEASLQSWQTPHNTREERNEIRE